MNDPFGELGLSRALAVGSEEIDLAYREASRRLHPDAGGEKSAYESMRTAADLLKSPSRRLRWALDSVGADWDERGSVPVAIMDLFSKIAESLQAVEDFLAERAKSKSTLGRAVLDVKVPPMKRQLEEVLDLLESEKDLLVEKFSRYDQRGWEESREEMAEAARGLAFLEKWQGQVRAATGKLFQALLGGMD